MRHTFSWTLSSESGESIAKQIKMTCESGYDSGRRRLACLAFPVTSVRKARAVSFLHRDVHLCPLIRIIGKRMKKQNILVVLLTSGIPQRQLDLFTVNLDIGDIVFEHGRNVDFGEHALGEDNQPGCISVSCSASWSWKRFC